MFAPPNFLRSLGWALIVVGGIAAFFFAFYATKHAATDIDIGNGFFDEAVYDATAPVYMALFKVDFSSADAAHFMWVTRGENDNQEFLLQRRLPSGAFETLKSIPGAGTTSEERVYETTIEGTALVNADFRLTQVSASSPVRLMFYPVVDIPMSKVWVLVVVSIIGGLLMFVLARMIEVTFPTAFRTESYMATLDSDSALFRV